MDGVGVLLTNLGTPDSCAVGDVRRYLREFLSDARVVNLPRWWWLPVLHLVVLNTRPKKSARAYKKVWTTDGSPLLVNSRRQQRALKEKLGAVTLELGMRYGNPSIKTALANLRVAGVDKLLVLPLYPQHCSATTASTFDAVAAALDDWQPALRRVNDYHDHAGYINALAKRVRAHRLEHSGDVLLMSFHGIPAALADAPVSGHGASDPYPDQCKKTARMLAEELNLRDDEWRLAFQSRFGAARWLQPYTTDTLTDLAREGRGVQIVCPGFSADCLETLEEIAIQNRKSFYAAGGNDFGYIPCLNDDDEHIRALADIVAEHIRDWN